MNTEEHIVSGEGFFGLRRVDTEDGPRIELSFEDRESGFWNCYQVDPDLVPPLVNVLLNLWMDCTDNDLNAIEKHFPVSTSTDHEEEN